MMRSSALSDTDICVTVCAGKQLGLSPEAVTPICRTPRRS